MVTFDLQPLLQGQTRTAKLKSAHNLLIIDPRGCNYHRNSETNLLEIMGWEFSDVMRFDLGPLLQGQTRTAKLKNALSYKMLQESPISVSFIIPSTGLLYSGIHRQLAKSKQHKSSYLL